MENNLTLLQKDFVEWFDEKDLNEKTIEDLVVEYSQGDSNIVEELKQGDLIKLLNETFKE